jgi:hypothetical protein
VSRRRVRISIGLVMLLAAFETTADDGNAALFADCEVWERHFANEGVGATHEELLAITRCGSYFLGAFDTLQFRNEGQCRLEAVSASIVIAQYLAYNRRIGVPDIYRGGPVWKVLDACHCGGQPALPDDVCEARSGAAP